MQIFMRLLFAHLLTDFTFQNNFIAAWKRKSIFGVIAHCLIFFICGAILCFNYNNDIWFVPLKINGWGILLCLTVLHFIEDQWRIQSIYKKSNSDSFFFFILDQVIHIALLFFLVPFRLSEHIEKWIVLGIIFVLTTHFTSVFIYFLEKDIQGYSKHLTNEKYYFMIERLAISLTLLLPGWWVLSSVVVWLLMFMKQKRYCTQCTYSILNIILGNCMAVFFGLTARLIYYS